MKIICLSGKAGSGKDTVAGMIEKRLEEQGKRVLVTHNADLLKFICASFFGWNGEKDEYGRSLLQQVGTGAVRSRNPDYWVDFLIDMFTMFGDHWDYVLIPDCRFPNEIDKLIKTGFDVTSLCIKRPVFNSKLTAEQQSHVSETAMSGYKFDYEILNDGSLADLKNSVEIVLPCLNQGDVAYGC